ncbi:hypothetical protein GOP47_0025417 [Adiantum capillus-veneris]|uniref:Uncharacterized protein n=1 Tax=Adiantum capillus-veneris TaxID=13818 RepID=A0A9D4U0L3_ADICA|nr:hypothetical protein GOP47_0025417 [Adiantum capillus-veneris]
MPAAADNSPISTSARTAIDSTIADFVEETKNAAAVQTNVLTNITPQCAHRPYFDRIGEGDRSAILTADPIETLSLSSGTTSDGQQKYLVLYKEILEASGRLGKIAAAYRSRAFPTRAGGMFPELVLWKIVHNPRWACLWNSHDASLSKQRVQAEAEVGPCSPDEVVRHSDNGQAMYCHLLCALLCWEELEFMTATFAYTFVEAFRTFKLEWANLCEDIRHGKLNSWITDPALRAAMSKFLRRPDPKRADIIAAKCCALEGWAGVIPAIWPNCKYIYSIMTGSMEPYLNCLQHYAGTLRTSWEEGNPVGLTEVEVGREYEVLLTTYGGLYRYKLGDVVRVTSFFNASPQLAYVCQRNVLLTVHIDKNTEKDLQIAVNEALEELKRLDANAELVDFTSFADLSSSPGHYVLFWELSRRSNCKLANQETAMPPTNDDDSDAAINSKEQALCQESALRECATAMDLAFVDPGYVGSRKIKTIGALELFVVEPGTFRFLLDRYLKRGIGAIAQYKTPRCIPSQEVLDILTSRVVLSVCSGAYL